MLWLKHKCLVESQRNHRRCTAPSVVMQAIMQERSLVVLTVERSAIINDDFVRCALRVLSICVIMCEVLLYCNALKMISL